MARTRRPSLTPDEARQLHYDALVIDAQQPVVTSGMLFTGRMRTALGQLAAAGLSQYEAEPFMAAMAAREIQTSAAARAAYLDVWRRSGVTVACGTYSPGLGRVRPSQDYERAVEALGWAHAIVEALDGNLLLIRTAAAGVHGPGSRESLASAHGCLDAGHAAGVRRLP